MTEVADVIQVLDDMRSQCTDITDDNGDNVEVVGDNQDRSAEVDDDQQDKPDNPVRVNHYDKVYQAAVDTGARYNVGPSMPRLCAKQMHR